jgi:hypothetical protein
VEVVSQGRFRDIVRVCSASNARTVALFKSLYRKRNSVFSLTRLSGCWLRHVDLMCVCTRERVKCATLHVCATCLSNTLVI